MGICPNDLHAISPRYLGAMHNMLRPCRKAISGLIAVLFEFCAEKKDLLLDWMVDWRVSSCQSFSHCLAIPTASAQMSPGTSSPELRGCALVTSPASVHAPPPPFPFMSLLPPAAAAHSSGTRSPKSPITFAHSCIGYSTSFRTRQGCSASAA